MFNYNINISRVPSFYETYLIFPIFCLATIILFSCIIPINAENRISFSMTVILSIMVYLSVLSEQLPKTHNNPTITNNDLDYLDMLYRENLKYGTKDEIIIKLK